MTPETLAMLVGGIGFGLAGLAFGLGYFAVLRRSAELFVQPGRGRLAVLLTVARIVAAVVFLSVAARFGAAQILAALAGFLAARWLALRHQREVAP